MKNRKYQINPFSIVFPKNLLFFFYPTPMIKSSTIWWQVNTFSTLQILEMWREGDGRQAENRAKKRGPMKQKQDTHSK